MYFPSFSLPIVFFHSLDVSWQFASVIALRLSCGFLHPEDFAKNSLDVPDGTGSSVKRCQPVTASLWTPTWPAALGFRIGRRTLLPGSHHCWPLLLNGIQGKCHRCRSYHLLLNWIRGNSGKRFKVMVNLRDIPVSLYTCIQIHSSTAISTPMFKNNYIGI